MNNLNELENIPNPSQPVILPPFISAEDLQAKIKARRENARIRQQMSRSSQSSEKDASLLDDGSIGISKLKKLHKLDISFSPITDESTVEISSMINITSLNIAYCMEITDIGFYYLSMLTNLTILDIRDCVVSNKVLEYLSTLTNLVSLDLKWCSIIKDDGTIHLSNLINLTYLDLANSRLSNLNFLIPLVNITYLDLSRSLCWAGENNLNLDNNVFLPISNLTKITSLDLSTSFSLHFHDPLAINFLSNLTNLTSLSLSGLTKITNLTPLESLVKLKYLNLDNCVGIRDEQMIIMSYLTKLERLQIDGCNLTKETYDYLRSLDLNITTNNWFPLF